MKTIKINYKDQNAKRTSTTLNETECLILKDYASVCLNINDDIDEIFQMMFTSMSKTYPDGVNKSWIIEVAYRAISRELKTMKAKPKDEFQPETNTFFYPMSTKSFLKFAREKGLMTIQKPYGICAGDYTLMHEDAYGNRYKEPKLYYRNQEINQ